MGKEKTQKRKIQVETRRLREEKLQRAYQLRDFEIEMYWKRAQYFWSFIAVIYAGYFLLITYDQSKGTLPAEYILVTSGIGCIFSFAWYLVNRGSKRWQEHWEVIINKYEDELGKPLYNEYVKVPSSLLNAGFFSVSRINIAVSFVVFLSWVLLGIFSVSHISDRQSGCWWIYITTISLVFLYAAGSKKK